MAELTTAGAEAVDLLVELIRNGCVNDGSADSGHEHRSVATLQEYFGQGGTVVEPRPGRQSVVYRVPGSGAGPTLLLLPHLDVVPASGTGWTHDPFAGVRADGFVFGRGAVDMLNLTAAMAVAFKPYLDGTVAPLPGDLVYVGVADEEAGGIYGAEHLVRKHWDLVTCDFVLTEVAGPSFQTPHGSAIPVTVAEKGPTWTRLTTRGRPGHGSQPYGTSNALLPLAEALTKLAAAPTPVDITEEWRTFVTALHLDDDLEAQLLDPDRVDDAIDRLAVDDPAFARWVHACTHLTITPTVIGSGVKANVVPELGEGLIDVRKLPGQDAASVDDHFRKVLGPGLYEEIEFDHEMSATPTSSLAEGPLWDAMSEAAAQLTGSAALIPAITPVGTDARLFRERGIPSYGVGLFDDRVTFGEMLSMFHGDDERVSEGSIDLTTQMLAATFDRFGAHTA